MNLGSIKLPILAAAMFAALPSRAMACAACFGQSDSDLAHGLNAGILFLFVIVAAVLGGFAAFFIYLARRSARVSAAAEALARDGDDSWRDSDGGELVSSSRWEAVP
jgi:hypothetical protein